MALGSGAFPGPLQPCVKYSLSLPNGDATGRNESVLSTIRTALTIIFGVLAIGIAGVGLLARYLLIGNHAVLFAAAFSPYLTLGLPVALLVLLAGKQRLLGVLAGALAVAMVTVQIPMYIRQSAPPDSIRLRVFTANLYLGQTDARSLVASATARADVLALQELTPDEVMRLSAAGLDRSFPYRLLDARDYASGGGLWSRFPIEEPARIPYYHLAVVSARLRVEGVSVNPAILVAHLAGPWPQPIDAWQWDLARAAASMRELATAAGSGCALVAGDFNSTPDMRPFRQLLGIGYRDAAEQSGSGLTPTYPANISVPPLLALDHVLTRHCTASAAETVKLPGSDHRGLVATVEIPRTAGDSGTSTLP